jgi:hypothetical protein
VCVCVCVRARENKALLLCSVMSVVLLHSSKSYGRLYDFRHISGQWMLHSWTEADGTTPRCAERFFRTRSTGQYIYSFLPNTVADNGDLNIIYWSNYFIPPSHEHYFLNVHFNIMLNLFIHASAAPFAHTKLSGTYFFCKSPHLSIYILNKCELTVNFSQTCQRYSSVL